MPMFGQQPQQLNGFMGAANPHPMFSTMLGAPAGNVDVTMTAAQMQQFQAQIQLGYQAQMAEAAKQKEAADAKAATEQQGLITSAVQAAVGAIVPKRLTLKPKSLTQVRTKDRNQSRQTKMMRRVRQPRSPRPNQKCLKHSVVRLS